MIKENDTPLHIMLADDDEDDRNFFNDAINDLKISHKLTIFKNGQDLMEYLEHPDTVLPDILFLDLNMPCKTGNECLKDIRSNPKFKDISIAIYSTSSSDKDIEETFVGGANIYIKKPNDFSKLKKVLNEVVNINWQFHTSKLNKDTFFFSI